MNFNAQIRYLILSILLIGGISTSSIAQNKVSHDYSCKYLKQVNNPGFFSNTGVNGNYAATRSDTIDITNLSINLNITDFAGQTISGNCEVSITSLQDNVSQLSLDLLALNIDSITSGSNMLSYTYNDTLLKIALSSTLSKGDSTVVTVYYNGSPSKDASWGGWYWQGNYAYNMGVAFTSLPHNYGRVWFPCFDNFVERSSYTFNIITADGRNAKCNGTYLGVTSLGGDTIINHWRLDETMPTYLACVAVGAFETVTIPYTGLGGPVLVEIYGEEGDTSNARASFTNLASGISAFENAYGAYKWNKVGYSLVPFNAGAMEHVTNIAYPRSFANSSLVYEDIMSHELAHMWWGDLVTCETAADMWLNEGMAEFSSFMFTENVYGWEAYRDLIINNHENIIHMAHQEDGGRYPLNAMPLNVTYGEQTYNKGADVAHSLRGYMGDSLFFGGLTSFLEKYKFSHMNSYMLRDHLTQFSGIDLSDFFDKWVFNVGWPHFSIDSVSVSPNGPAFTADVYVRQKRHETDYYSTNVPMEITFFDTDWSEYSVSIMASGLLSSESFNIPFSPIYTAINYHNKISDAVSSQVRVLSAPGSYNFVNGLPQHMTFTVNSITDSALIRVEHNRTYPDPIQGLTNYRICPNRYWKVDGIMPSNYSMSVKMFYDGRESKGYYFDHDLFDSPDHHEDSIVVMYRTDAGSAWSEWPYITQTIIAPNDNWGQVVLDSFALGEYVFALKVSMFDGSTSISNVSYVSCAGACDGAVTVSADGGVGPYVYMWDDPSNQQTSTATGLCPGSYTVIVIDAASDTVVKTVSISEHDILGGFSTTTLESCSGCNDGTIEFTASGGATPYVYQWNDPQNQNTITATGLSAGGTYTLVLSDANGCTFTSTGLTLGEGYNISKNLDILLSPNPTSNNFTVLSADPLPKNTNLVITDIGGREIYSRPIGVGARRIDIQTTTWKSGIYLVAIRNEDGLLFSDKLIYTKD